MTPWPSDTRVLQVLPQSWRVPSQARSEHFGHFNFHQMWPHSVWPLCLTLADLETFVWHDLGSFKCQACQVYHFVRSSKRFSTRDLFKIQNCRNICSESITLISTHIPDKILRKLFPIESQARPWWLSSASGWEGGRPSGGFNHRLLCDHRTSWVNSLLFGQSHRSQRTAHFPKPIQAIQTM